MKKILALLFCLVCLRVNAADQVSAIITVTNFPTNGYTMTVNGNVRVWTNTITTNASQFQTTNTIGLATTNMMQQIASYPYSGPITLQNPDTNKIRLIALPGNPLVVTVSTNWATVALTTNTVTTLIPVRIPVSGEPTASQRTNIANGLVIAIDTYATNLFATNSPSLLNYVTISNIQTVFAKILSGGRTTNTAIGNGTNYGLPFSSPGAVTNSQQFGQAASALAANSLAVGLSATASNASSTAIGASSFAYAASDTVVGTSSSTVGGAGAGTIVGAGSTISAGSGSTGVNDTIIGSGSTIAGDNSFGIGVGVIVNHNNNIVFGNGVQSDADNQIKFGDNTYEARFPGNASFDGYIRSNLNVAANLNLYGTNRVASSLAFTRKNNTSMANGDNNAAVDISTNFYVKLSGNTAAFGIAGISGGTDGRMVILQNSTGFNMKLQNDAGGDPTAANRIYTGTGADVTLTSAAAANPVSATLIYDSAVSRWILVSKNP